MVFISEEWINKNIINCDEKNSEKITKVHMFINEEKLVNKNEEKFLNEFEEYTLGEKLYYDKEDLINFHISVKTNPLTIIAGMSGTGKTQLARAYAKMLGLKEEKEGTLLFLPITPSYIEPQDLTGYLNITNGLYISSETGLVDFLLRAESRPDKIHMVIFDEMNLAQVEYWFAQFISLLELEPNERNLYLYGENCICHNNTKYKRVVNIGNNVIFVGTVNLDETTKEFSDRLLDRANIITLNKKKFIEIRGFLNTECKQSKDSYKEYSFDEYCSWCDKRQGLTAFNLHEMEFLDELHSIIQKYDLQKGISFRVAEKIGNYLNNIPKKPSGDYIIPRKRAFDIQIKQRVLTKLKGAERQFGKLIGKIDLDSSQVIESELYKLIDKGIDKNISEFDLTKKEIQRKAKELTLYGYTS